MIVWGSALNDPTIETVPAVLNLAWAKKLQEITPEEVEDLKEISEVEKVDSVEDIFKWEWTGKHVTPEFKAKVVEICNKLGINPDDLMAVMAFEAWLDPTTVNKYSGATGLIQFTDRTAKDLGTTTAALKNMTAVEQLDYVYKYLELLSKAGKLKSLPDIYVSILCGRYSSAIGKPDNTVLWSKGSDEYEQNNGLDMDGDGNITKAEATQMVIDRRNTYNKK